jgi:hypothetical protein
VLRQSVEEISRHRTMSLFSNIKKLQTRSQWLHGLRFGSAAVRLLRLRVRIRRWHGCLSVVSVVCCQLQVSVTGWSPVQRSPTECGVSVSMVRCNKNSPQPLWVGRRTETKILRKNFKHYTSQNDILIMTIQIFVPLNINNIILWDVTLMIRRSLLPPYSGYKT